MQTIDTLLEQLKNENFTVNTDALQNQSKETPWFVNVLVGISAWLSVILTLVFIFSMYHDTLRDDPYLWVLFGVFLSGLSIFLQWRYHHLFINQFTLASCITGVSFILIGLGFAEQNLQMICITNILLQLLLLYFFENAIHRFLSVPAIVISALILLQDAKLPALLHVLIAVLALLLCYFLMHREQFVFGRIARVYPPLVAGLGISFMGLFIILHNRDLSKLFDLQTTWISTLLMAIAMLYFTTTILTKLSVSLFHGSSLTLIFFIVLLALSTLKSPGILAALLLMSLSFYARNPWMLGISLFSLIGYIISYYYYLDLTLLTKSLILILGGLLFLGTRVIFNKMAGEKR